jgi:hypothetical protein
MKQTIYGISAGLSLLLLIGTAGALEHVNITPTRHVIQSVVLLAAFLLTAWKAGAFENAEEREEENNS